MPALVGGFGNYLVHLLLGTPDIIKYNTSIHLMTSLISPHKQFGTYLAGLWEGNGSIWIPKTSHAPGGKCYTPHVTPTHPLSALVSQLFWYHAFKQHNSDSDRKSADCVPMFPHLRS